MCEVTAMGERKLSVEEFDGIFDEHDRERRIVAREGMVERWTHGQRSW